MLLLASEGTMEWLNYPGLELWKFVNLAIFAALGIYVLRRPISQALLARRESIRQEILAAQNERDQSLARIAEADNLLGKLDADVRTVREQATQEAQAERQRLAVATARELEKLKQQAQREMETADKLARKGLRKYLAQRSVDMARVTIKNQMRPEDDTHLIKENMGELRRTTV
jgi:F0F1-type ATP synthase membrane subunit b/b'